MNGPNYFIIFFYLIIGLPLFIAAIKIKGKIDPIVRTAMFFVSIVSFVIIFSEFIK